MKKSNSKPLSSIIRQWLEEEPEIHEQVLIASALNSLPKILGGLFQYVSSSNIHDSILYLKLNSSVLRQQLMMQKKVLIEKINAEVEVELIRDIHLS